MINQLAGKFGIKAEAVTRTFNDLGLNDFALTEELL